MASDIGGACAPMALSRPNGVGERPQVGRHSRPSPLPRIVGERLQKRPRKMIAGGDDWSDVVKQFIRRYPGSELNDQCPPVIAVITNLASPIYERFEGGGSALVRPSWRVT